MNVTTYYHTVGSACGDCGHKHRSIGAAVRCMERDEKACSRQGGYSDREVFETVADGSDTQTRRLRIEEWEDYAADYVVYV